MIQKGKKNIQSKTSTEHYCLVDGKSMDIEHRMKIQKKRKEKYKQLRSSHTKQNDN